MGKIYGPSPSIDRARLRQLLDHATINMSQMAQVLGVSVPTVTRTMRALGWKSVKGRGLAMERNYFWNGGRMTDSDGYVLLKCPDHPQANNNGYVREHRLVMERKLGRYLLPSEVVHHRKEGDRANNDPENLELYPSNGRHLRDHMEAGTIPRCPVSGRLVKKPGSGRRRRKAPA